MYPILALGRLGDRARTTHTNPTDDSTDCVGHLGMTRHDRLGPCQFCDLRVVRRGRSADCDDSRVEPDAHIGRTGPMVQRGLEQRILKLDIETISRQRDLEHEPGRAAHQLRHNQLTQLLGAVSDRGPLGRRLPGQHARNERRSRAVDPIDRAEDRLGIGWRQRGNPHQATRPQPSRSAPVETRRRGIGFGQWSRSQAFEHASLAAVRRHISPGASGHQEPAMTREPHWRTQLTFEDVDHLRVIQRKATDRDGPFRTQQDRSVAGPSIDPHLAVSAEPDGGHVDRLDHRPVATDHSASWGDARVPLFDHGNIGRRTADV